MGNQDELFEQGTANIYADLGFPDPDTHLLKARLVSRVAGVMKESRMTQVAAAKAVGSNQPEMSRILRGHFREVSVERLMRMLTLLGCDVDIVIRPQNRPTATPAVIHFNDAAPA